MAKDFNQGDFVSWSSSGGTARGQITRIERNGTINIPDSSFTVEGTEEDPAALIRLYRDGEPTDTFVGHRFSTLTSIDKPKSMKARTKSAGLRIKDMDMAKGIVQLYASTFNDLDSDKDRMKSGCYEKSIKEAGPEGTGRIRHLYQHDPDQPMGKPIKMYEDADGLFVESYVSTMRNGDYRKMYTEGLVNEHSVGFMPDDADGNGMRPNEDGGFDFYKVNLMEFSTVTWGANEKARLVSMKSQQPAQQLKELNAQIDALEKAIFNGTFTDETFFELESRVSKLKSISQAISAPNLNQQGIDFVSNSTEGRTLTEIFNQLS